MKLLPWSVLALVFAGCGSSSSTTTADGGSTTPLTPDAQTAKLCSDAVAPFCDALFACCADPQTLARFGGSADACKTTFAASCKTDLGDAILPSAKAGATVLDESRLAACVASLGGMKAGGAACTRPPQFVLIQDCVDAFRGQLAPGAVCDASKLPDMGFVPCKAGTCKNGTCNAYLAAGAACDPTQNNLSAAGCNFPDGYTCTGTGTAGTCVKRGAVGDVCDTKSSGFSCESMACGLDGKCMAPTADLLCKGG